MELYVLQAVSVRSPSWSKDVYMPLPTEGELQIPLLVENWRVSIATMTAYGMVENNDSSPTLTAKRK